eukprot:CAMPEP_0170155698 /NCGR_PEP_ID=MMETSP0033_2-20121228/61330_1 /TAXON_ID=195969 /ORGANISM="Dolichomastix tenuilepis, Strain CCMP3274" /LENGTH=33 /DNA_ID= /DNA_START= /DNA_END= /DNA_ORIENTATION=
MKLHAQHPIVAQQEPQGEFARRKKCCSSYDRAG